MRSVMQASYEWMPIAIPSRHYEERELRSNPEVVLGCFWIASLRSQ